MAICGSSVAFGWRSPKDEGWSALLANALKKRYGHQIFGDDSTAVPTKLGENFGESFWVVFLK